MAIPRRCSWFARCDAAAYGIALGSPWLPPSRSSPSLNRELGLERLLLEGGGGSNGSFLRAGLIDEINLAICPAVDGAKCAPSIFDSGDKDAGIARLCPSSPVLL